MALQRSEEAWTTINQGLEADPEDLPLRILKVQALLARGRFDGLLEIARTFDHPFYRNYFQALAYLGKRELNRAEEILTRLPRDRAVIWKLAQVNFMKGNLLAARDYLLSMLRAPSLQNDLWCIVALIKIEKMGNLGRSPILDTVIQNVDSSEAARLSTLAEQLKWEFIAEQATDEVNPRSLANPFCRGLNDRPVDGHTRRSTWSARIP